MGRRTGAEEEGHRRNEDPRGGGTRTIERGEQQRNSQNVTREGRAEGEHTSRTVSGRAEGESRGGGQRGESRGGRVEGRGGTEGGEKEREEKDRR